MEETIVGLVLVRFPLRFIENEAKNLFMGIQSRWRQGSSSEDNEF